MKRRETFALLKTLIDAHTMGVHAAAALLRECGYRVVISPTSIEYALERITAESSQRKIINWIKDNCIDRIGFSYRLDPDKAVELFGRLVQLLIDNGYYGNDGAQIKSIYFAGLKSACEMIDKEYNGRISTFRGGESAEETLLVMGVPLEDIPHTIKIGCQYDKDLATFGESIIKSGEYLNMIPFNNKVYPEFGTIKDTLELRLNSYDNGSIKPVIRAHCGPYSNNMSREAMLKEYCEWCRELGKSGLLDVLSIGSSQLSQSNFGEKWGEKPNGGGVPVNSEMEFIDIWQAARPMLVRTYSGTKNIRKLAEIYEKTIDISWHALSLWWFDELDGRGPNSLYNNLCEHIDTINYIATTGKPLETNVSHHFAFRGADDITYIVSGVIAAKIAKKYGIKVFVLQNMLNTPRSTWGVQDLAKGRALLNLVKELEDKSFRVILQTRAGLDYFKPNIDKAKQQLASVTALMDDIDPSNIYSPQIIHVVSYSEALFLATPEILNDSILITLFALERYREKKKCGETPNVMTEDIIKRQIELERSCREVLKAMENNIPDLYTPKGLYLAFVAGWLPVPELWTDSDEFVHAKGWGSKVSNGGVVLCDHELAVSTDYRINRCCNNLSDALYIFKNKYYRNNII